MAWIAACDGEVSDRELEAIRLVAKTCGHENDLSESVAIGRNAALDDLQLASEAVRGSSRESAKTFLRLVIGVALEDGVVTTSEVHMLRFITDLLGLATLDLEHEFNQLTDSQMPSPSDLSDIRWWTERERERQSQSNGHESRSKHDERASESAEPHSPDSKLSRLRDLAILGLDEAATLDDVKDAYRRLAKIHHPDRFGSLGRDAVNSATDSFRRIQTAYERLVGA